MQKGQVGLRALSYCLSSLFVADLRLFHGREEKFSGGVLHFSSGGLDNVSIIIDKVYREHLLAH